PTTLTSGAISFVDAGGSAQLTLLPPAIKAPDGTDITPAGLHWRLQQAGASWKLLLDLDDTNFPLPYVIDPATWYSTAWPYRKAITIDHTKVSATLSNFPVLINLPSDADLAANAQASGNDIVFTAADKVTTPSHQIEQYTSATA